LTTDLIQIVRINSLWEGEKAHMTSPQPVPRLPAPPDAGSYSTFGCCWVDLSYFLSLGKSQSGSCTYLPTWQ